MIFNRMLLLWVSQWPLPRIYSYTNPWNLWVLPDLDKGIEHKTEKEKTRGHRGEGRVRTETEMRTMHLKAKAGQELPPATSSFERLGTHSPPEPLEGTYPYQHLDFRILASRTMRKQISIVLSRVVCGGLLD